MTYDRHSQRSHSLPNLNPSGSLRSSNPAVIRPLQPSAIDEAASRLDTSQSIRGPHRRVERLEEYVSWLQQQSQKELNSRDGGTDTSTRRPIVSQSPTPNSHAQASQQKPIIQIVQPSPSTRAERTDEPHLHGGMASPPRPKTPANQFQPDSDLQRIIQKLETTEVRRPNHSQQHEAEPTVPTYEPVSFRSNDSATPRPRVTPAEFAQPYRESGAVSHPSDEFEIGQVAPQLTKKEIIQTISSAIASVLTDQADPIIESKIRQQLKDLQLEFVDEGHANSSAHSGSVPEEKHVGYSSQPSTINQPIGSPQPPRSNPVRAGEIPTWVAAWDVSDFRWPTISEQMMTHGADAIATLTSTVVNTLRGTRRRVAVTSPERVAGTTSIAMGLARWAAREGQRVLLVDADIAHPELSTLLGLGPGISWLNGINRPNGELPHPAELIIRSQQLPLCVLPLFPVTSRNRMPGCLFDYLGKLLDPVTFEFDLVILDTGPAQQIVAELSQGQTLIDTALIVHHDKTARVTQVQNQLQSLNVDQFVFAQNSIRPNVKSNVA